MTTPPSETQRVAAELSRRVRDLPAGAEIGSVRSLAAEFNVSADVARRALGILVQHGQVRAEARRHVVANPTAGPQDLVHSLRSRVAELERRLDYLYRALGQHYPGETTD